MPNPFHQLLDSIREATTTEADKGKRFEVLIKRFLQAEPTYKERFSDVWLWTEWPYRMGKGDIGIDLVARESVSGHYVAIQCKCYDNGHAVSEKDLETFFLAAGSTWATDNAKEDTFESTMVFATSYYQSKNLATLIQRQAKPCQYIGLSDLERYEDIDWAALEKGKIHKVKKNEVREHQREAIDSVISSFKGGTERGKMIMACGTGKTFTALRLVEEYTGGEGCVLFLAPSIALVAQSLREWMCQTTCKLHPIAVCSDSTASDGRELGDLTARDLPSPATTNPDAIGANYRKFKDGHLTVIFSTYASLDKVCAAQKKGRLPEFDITICDEAHRTAGASMLGEDGNLSESDLRRVHDQKYLKSKKRLYMTATPKVYGEAVHEKARQTEGAVLADMNDVTLYGEELYTLPFSRAVRENLLTDYKVLVLCVDEQYAGGLVQKSLVADGDEPGEGQLKLDDAVRLVGCYNGLRKRMVREVKAHAKTPDDILQGAADYGEEAGIAEAAEDDAPYSPDHFDSHEEDFILSDPGPMLRAVSFAGFIKDSKTFAKEWEVVVDAIRENEAGEADFLPSVMQHVDGTMPMSERERLLHWLKEPSGGECRILSNAKCLSEGVDVPALDAIMFLAPKRSQIDIVQSVGRVMRRDPQGRKKYGYIIIPIGIPRDADANELLDKDERFKVVWQVLQALRSHDDRLEAEINSVDFNRREPGGGGGELPHVGVRGVTGKHTHDGETEGVQDSPTQGVLPLIFAKKVAEYKDAIFAKMVERCGTKPYWEKWAKDISVIAERQQRAIAELAAQPEYAERFTAFVNGLKENIRPDIDTRDAVEMLSMQLVSRPVFNALFGEYEFAEKNPVSVTMNAMLDFVEGKIAQDDLKTLRNFYEDVKNRAGALKTAAARQTVIKELYENFFQNAFKKMSEKLGIVYTPVEVVDFIVHSVHRVLQQEFGVQDGIGAEGVRILDPFTGTGTFIVRAIQSGLIKRSALPRKYRQELFASEIVLLAYYIACINIEVAYHGAVGQEEYEPFEGICLTDTFMMHENCSKDQDLFPQFEDNGERVKRLCKQDIRVIIGNPPYSVGQNSANDNNQNNKYPKLDARIAETYAAGSKATNKNSLYDSYIRAFRWGSDCIKGDGVLAFVSNGAYIDNNAMVGFRESLMDEFSTIYCFNLRGNCRTSGEQRRKEAGNVFKEGSRTPVAIIVLVKKAGHKKGQRAKLFYHDIGDYWKREEKLDIIKQAVDIGGIKWEKLVPDEHGDWVNHRTEGYEQYMPIGVKSKNDPQFRLRLFDSYCRGVATSRDAWCYSFSQKAVAEQVAKSVSFYNAQVKGYEQACQKKPQLRAVDFIDNDPTEISWSRAYREGVEKGRLQKFSEKNIRSAVYRPFCKQNLYFARQILNDVGPMDSYFPSPAHRNVVIAMPGVGVTKAFCCLITEVVPDVQLMANGQCFPLYWYEKREKNAPMLPGLDEGQDSYTRRDGITDYALKEYQRAYGDPKIGKEDIFYYVYGLLHSPEYRAKFENDLKKELPRIPRVKKFWDYSRAGRKLAELHLDYESAEPYPAAIEQQSGGNFRVEDKIRFPKKGVKDAIVFNSTTVVRDIPLEAYDYIVNGKSAIEWVMERYAVTTDKDSGIVNDPNLWCEEHDDPEYIINLLLRVITVSLETVKIVNSLPPMEIID